MDVLYNSGTVLPETSSEEELKLAEEGLITVTATPIDNPDAEYLASTTKIDISGLPFDSTHTTISDGTLTVTFSAPVTKRGPVPDGWLTWSSPPFSEDPNPDVLYAIGQTTLTMDLSRYVRTFGFELEPNPLSPLILTVEFYDDGTLVESITRQVNGNAGARLFARTGDPINRVVITGPADFAIAQVRYLITISPEAQAFVLALVLLLLIVLSVILLA